MGVGIASQSKGSAVPGRDAAARRARRPRGTRRTTLGLLLLLGVPTILLGAGWLGATARESDALERGERARLARAADAVRAAVDEGLEELPSP